MINGVCPKCNSNNIIKIPSAVSGFETGNKSTIVLNSFSVVSLSRFLCCSCGFSEEWIDDKSDLDRVIKKYTK